MKRPSFQFYPGDWRANSNLGRCNHEEKGMWIDSLCVLHDQEEYGVVRWPLKELARAIGSTPAKLRRLIDKGVLKGSDPGQQCEPLVYVPRSGHRNGPPVTLIEAQPGPIWYSSRMVTDEYKRQHMGASTRFGATPNDDANSPELSPSQRQGDGSSSSTSSSTSSSNNNKTPSATNVAGYSQAFLKFWELYPQQRHVNKGAAFKAFKKISAAEYPAIREGLERKKKSPDWLKDNGQFIPHAATWLNARGWEDEDAQPKQFDMQRWVREHS